MNTPYIKETQQSNISELAVAGSWLERPESIPHLLDITLLKVHVLQGTFLTFKRLVFASQVFPLHVKPRYNCDSTKLTVTVIS